MVKEEDMSRFDVERFDPEPDEEFICCICQGVLDKPMETPCRHVFCKVCIEHWLGNGDNKTCPTCRGALTVPDLCPALPLLNNLINKLRPNCLNRRNGCQNSWLVENFDSEHEKQCEYRLVKCNFDNCKTQIMAKNAGKHEEKCDYRPYVCKKLCGLTIVAKDKSTHACVPLLKETVEELKKKLEAAQQEVERLQERNTHLQGLLDQPGSARGSEQSPPSWQNVPSESEEDRNSMSSIVDFLLTSPSDRNSQRDSPESPDSPDSRDSPESRESPDSLESPESPDPSDRSRRAESSLTDSMVGFSESSDDGRDEPAPLSRPIMISSDSSGGYRSLDVRIRTTHYTSSPASPLMSSSESRIGSLHNSSSSRSDQSDSRQSYTSYRDDGRQRTPQSPRSVRSYRSNENERYSSVDAYDSPPNRRKRTRIVSSNSSQSSHDSYQRRPPQKRSRVENESDYDNNSPLNIMDSDDHRDDSANSTSESQYR